MGGVSSQAGRTRLTRLLLSFAIVLAVLLPVTIISFYLLPRSLPWWMDGGDWLKRVNAILGNSYPMWEQTTLQYPPLFFVLVAGFSSLMGEIHSLELWALISYALVPFVTYFFVKELFNDRIVALAAAWLTGLTPIWLEMFGWGGFPDLLGLSLLPFAFLGVLRFSKKGSVANFLLLAAGSVLVPLTHHLTFIAFGGVLAVWGFASTLFDRSPLKAIVASGAVTIATFVVYRLAAGPFQFLLSNQAAMTYLLADESTLFYMFKSLPLMSLLYIVAVATVGMFLIERRFRTQTLLLLSWALVPILGTQGYLVGIASDYNRILFFLAQPFVLMVAASLVYRTEAWTFVKGLKSLRIPRTASGQVGGVVKPLAALAVVLLTLGAVIYAPFLGAQTMGNINAYYNLSDNYGDSAKLQVADYISSHTAPKSVVVAETSMARWVEGYAQRRVLLSVDPRYLFLTGELARDYAANAILFSERGMRNGYAWVFDQAPLAEFSPLISFYIGGEYQQVALLNESGSLVTWVNNNDGKNYTMPLSDSTNTSAYWSARTPQLASITATYRVGPVEITRQVTLGSTNGNVTFRFHASSPDSSVSVTGLTISLGPLPGLGLLKSTLVGNRTLALLTDLGTQFYSSSSGQEFPLKFVPAPGTSVVSGWASVWTNQAHNSTELVTYDRSDVVRAYGVTDVVVPKQFLAPVGQTENTTLRALPFYENLVRDPEFKVVYYNERAIVLQVVGISSG